MRGQTTLVQGLLLGLFEKTKAEVLGNLQSLQRKVLPIRNDGILGVQPEAEGRTHEAKSRSTQKSGSSHRRRLAGNHC